MKYRGASGPVVVTVQALIERCQSSATPSHTAADVVVVPKGSLLKISILDEKGDNYVVIDTQNKKITIETKTGDMLLKAKGTIRLEAKTIETASDKDTTIKAGANLDMKAQSNFTLKASGSGEVNSSGTLTVKGSTVNIN